MHPARSFQKACNHHGSYGIAGGIHHGGDGIAKLSQHNHDGQGFRRKAEHGDDHGLAYGAAAGNGGNRRSAEDGYQHCESIGSQSFEGNTENSAENRNLKDTAEAGTIHVHGCAHRQNYTADILGHADAVAGFQIYRNRSGAAAGTDGIDRRCKDILKKCPDSFLSRCHIGIQSKEKKRKK